MTSLLKRLHQRPISHYPIYTELTKSSTAGILLSQIMYWFSQKNKFYKTDADFKEETKLTENELRSAKRAIKNLDFIEVMREGIPAKTYYQIDWEKYEKTLSEFANSTVSLNSLNKIVDENHHSQTSLVKSTKLDELNSLNSDSEIHETINVIQETTPKTTTKNTLSLNLSHENEPQDPNEVSEEREGSENVDIQKTEQQAFSNLSFNNFINHIKGYFKNKTFAVTKDKYTGAVLKLSISNQGRLYNKLDPNYKDLDATRAVEIFESLYEKYRQKKLELTSEGIIFIPTSKDNGVAS